MKIIPYDPKYFQSFTKLLVNCFGVKNPKSDDLMQWKFFNIGEDKASITQCAIDKEQVVGQYSLIPIQITQQGKARHAFRSQDMCIAPEYRRKGLITKIAATAYERITIPSIILGFSNTQGVRVDRGSKKYGYAIIDQLTRIRLFPIFSNSPYTSQEHVIAQEIKYLSFKSFDYFEKHISVKKDYSYIKRRYFEKPGSTYRFFTFSQGEDVYGWAVLKFHRGVCSILDLNMKKETDIKSLFQAIQNIAYRNWSPIVTLMTLQNSLCSKLFDSIRTFKKKQPYYLTIKKHLLRDEADVLNKDQWWVVGGDVL